MAVTESLPGPVYVLVQVAVPLVSATGAQSALPPFPVKETVPVGTKSVFHLHRDSDEVAYVLEGEVTFLIGDEVTVGGPGSCTFMPRGVPHCWKGTGAETSQVLFLYTPAKAGGLIEEQQRTGRKFGSTPARRRPLSSTILRATRGSRPGCSRTHVGWPRWEVPSLWP